MYYFRDWQPNSKGTMNICCKTYRYDSSCDSSEKIKIAFHHHFHNVAEILAVKKGTLHVTVNNRQYNLGEGDVIFVNPFRLHYGTWSENGKYNEYICITFPFKKWLHFKDTILNDEMERLDNGKNHFDEFYNKEKQPKICSAIENIANIFPKTDPTSECFLASEVYLLLAELFSNHYHQGNTASQNHFNIHFMTDVSRYLFTHYTENISTADIAKTLYISIPNFCYQFKKYFGTTFLKYLTQYRITRAIEFYQEKEISLMELSASVGFDDYHYFSKVFRKYMGQSPSMYFKKRKAVSAYPDSDTN